MYLNIFFCMFLSFTFVFRVRPCICPSACLRASLYIRLSILSILLYAHVLFKPVSVSACVHVFVYLSFYSIARQFVCIIYFVTVSVCRCVFVSVRPSAKYVTNYKFGILIFREKFEN